MPHLKIVNFFFFFKFPNVFTKKIVNYDNKKSLSNSGNTTSMLL